MSNERAAVLGLGLIGGSVAAGLKVTGWTVVGYDPISSRGDAARQLQLVDEIADDSLAAVAGASCVVLAMPVLAVMQMLPVIESATLPDAMIIDVGSVKAPIVACMAKLRHPGRAIGGHPIAGSEKSGPEFASPSLLIGRTFVLCPSSVTAPATVMSATRLVSALKANPIVLGAAEHDALLARTSHAPQFISTTLAGAIEPQDLPFIGTGLRGMVRLGASEPAVWLDVALANSQSIAAELESFAADLQQLAGYVERQDRTAIESVLRSAAEKARAVLSGEAA